MFKEKLTFRPHSTSSQTHRKMTLSIADRASKAQKIRVLPAAGTDPEAQRSELIKVQTCIIYKLLYELIRHRRRKWLRKKYAVSRSPAAGKSLFFF